ncbi:hypothetical protein WMY93_024961 [Mugilogobius chulae]|uniref:small monomeric GTPase n=1 Tax=Mugilogobius chulae TaxID=88201 RepID=A0AAW0NDL2_9GOBI
MKTCTPKELSSPELDQCLYPFPAGYLQGLCVYSCQLDTCKVIAVCNLTNPMAQLMFEGGGTSLQINRTDCPGRAPSTPLPLDSGPDLGLVVGLPIGLMLLLGLVLAGFFLREKIKMWCFRHVPVTNEDREDRGQAAANVSSAGHGGHNQLLTASETCVKKKPAPNERILPRPTYRIPLPPPAAPSSQLPPFSIHFASDSLAFWFLERRRALWIFIVLEVLVSVFFTQRRAERRGKGLQLRGERQKTAVAMVIRHVCSLQMAKADQRYGQRDGSDQNFDYMFKLLIIGNSSVGKTSFLFRYADDSFSNSFVSTVGIDFKVKTVYRNDKRIKLQIWDTAGQERYRTITTAYYRGAMGFILMYDITNEESFNAVQDWATQIKTYSWDNAQVIMVGNKCDMDEERVVPPEKGKHLADQLGFEYYEPARRRT